MDKIPCIICDNKKWIYIEPYLKKWGYKFNSVKMDFETYDLLVINDIGNLGDCCNYKSNYCFNFIISSNFNRELITDVDEFLKRAAGLKGFIYNKTIELNKMEINGIEIKPGMVIVEENNNRWIVFPIQNNLAVVCFDKKYTWDTITNFKNSHKISKIVSASKGVAICDGDVLWNKDDKIKVSKEDIAKLLNCTPEQIEIV